MNDPNTLSGQHCQQRAAPLDRRGFNGRRLEESSRLKHIHWDRHSGFDELLLLRNWHERLFVALVRLGELLTDGMILLGVQGFRLLTFWLFVACWQAARELCATASFRRFADRCAGT